MREAYLDNSATTAVLPEVAKEIYDSMLLLYGNPSSLHKKGLDAELELNKARKKLAECMDAPEECVYFTSGGSEGNNAAIYGLAEKRRRFKKVIVSAYEHPSVLQAVKRLEKQGFEIVEIAPGEDGRISPVEIGGAIDKDTAFVSVMMVNNELGAINDIAAIAKTIKRKNPDVPLHTDAVQAFGKLKLNCAKLGAQVVTVSGHKIHAPKGIGAMYIEKNFRLPPFVVGGGQQSGQRGGTEPVAMAQGLAKAAEMAYASLAERRQRVAELRELLLKKLSDTEGVEINSPENALEYVVNISVTGIRSEIMLHHLESRGVYVSSGSACSKGAKSHVLAAMGLSQQRIDSALRISFSALNTEEDVEQLVDGIKEGIKILMR
ncbi:MAG: cysteine desulfurase [Oscillospiraceae bacterium]|nr:cysteine desulfurase [Oscillospiraceae bacterium]MBQ9939358.1 cysteine desulfurase [Oscillospiraceae bacterium]